MTTDTIDDKLQDDVNRFLDRLRETGAINMFGAAPYVAEVFGVGKRESRDLVKNWMLTFDERHCFLPERN